MSRHHSRRKDGLWKASLESNFPPGNVQMTYLLPSLQVHLVSLLQSIIVPAGVVWFQLKLTPKRDTLRERNANPSGHSDLRQEGRSTVPHKAGHFGTFLPTRTRHRRPLQYDRCPTQIELALDPTRFIPNRSSTFLTRHISC
ncbi:unnamed protein product [Ixodes persulcatus]